MLLCGLESTAVTNLSFYGDATHWRVFRSVGSTPTISTSNIHIGADKAERRLTMGQTITHIGRYA